MRVLSSELIKLRTTRLWWGMLIGTLLLLAFNVIFFAASAGQELGPGAPVLPELGEQAGITAAYGAGYQSGYLMVAILGAIIGSTDFRHRTATQTFLVTPGRGRVVAAKLLTGAIAGVLFAVIVQVVSVLLTTPFALSDGASLRLDEPDVLRSLVLGVVGIAVWGVIGVAAGTLIRNQIAAVVIVLLMIFLVETLLGLALGYFELDEATKYLPGNASIAVTEGFTGNELLSWWAGLLTLVGYGAVFTVVGYATSLRRDIN